MSVREFKFPEDRGRGLEDGHDGGEDYYTVVNTYDMLNERVAKNALEGTGCHSNTWCHS